MFFKVKLPDLAIQLLCLCVASHPCSFGCIWSISNADSLGQDSFFMQYGPVKHWAHTISNSMNVQGCYLICSPVAVVLLFCFWKQTEVVSSINHLNSLLWTNKIQCKIILRLSVFGKHMLKSTTRILFCKHELIRERGANVQMLWCFAFILLCLFSLQLQLVRIVEITFHSCGKIICLRETITFFLSRESL